MLDPAGGVLATVPLELEVLPLALRTPPVFFGVDNGLQTGPELARLRDYGINFIGADHDVAAKYGFKGYAIWPYSSGPPPFDGRRIGWNTFVKEKEYLAGLIAAGKAGKGPRGFFGGYVSYQKPNDNQETYAEILKELPGIDFLGYTADVYAFHGADYTHGGEPWRCQIRTRGKPDLLERAAEAGKEFWFVDWVRHSKEQPARFTFGFWLWRLGATGRFSTFSYGHDYHYATARQSYPVEPYYTLLGVVGGNACPAVKPALDGTDVVPARDLLLIREGTADYRYIYTLDRLLADADQKKLDAPAVAAARAFRDRLRRDLSLDLTRYYESRSASYAENWFPRADNPWTDGNFREVRREAAGHIVGVQKALGAGK